jgi:molybdopterin-containing oxidoreductase family iron-sulfur binding subunit
VLREALRKQHEKQGAGLRILTETLVSPNLIHQLKGFLSLFPQAKWHQYEPLARDATYRGAVMAYGKPVNTYCDLIRVDVVVSFDSDFLTCGPGNLRYVANFMSRRRVRTTASEANHARMNRLCVVETSLTSIGAKADHRLAVRASEIESLVWALALELRVPDVPQGAEVSSTARRWLTAVADDLRSPDAAPGDTDHVEPSRT